MLFIITSLVLLLDNQGEDTKYRKWKKTENFCKANTSCWPSSYHRWDQRKMWEKLGRWVVENCGRWWDRNLHQWFDTRRNWGDHCGGKWDDSFDCVVCSPYAGNSSGHTGHCSDGSR